MWLLLKLWENHLRKHEEAQRSPKEREEDLFEGNVGVVNGGADWRTVL